jgi:antitoxin component YwqK of YwqJK toxin-antitoxin module
MRILLTIVFLMFYGQSFCQIKQADLSDIAIVTTSIGDGDTSFWINDPYKVGEWMIYYDSTHKQKAFHVLYFDSKYRLISTEWFKSGQIRRETFGHYYLTPLHYNEWFPDGKVKVSSICKGDSCVNYQYYHNGQLAEKNIARGDSASDRMMTWCYFAEYYENGQLKSTPYDPNSRSRLSLVNYYPSGKIKSQVALMYHMPVGPWNEWYENGKLKTEGNFTEMPGDGQFHLTMKIGKWTYYDETGKKIKEEFYENDKLINTITY